VQAKAVVPGTNRPLFASIDPQGPSDGVVASQTPAAGTPVYPGRSRLLITLETPKPSALQTFLQGLVNAQEQQNRQTQVPYLTGKTAEAAKPLAEAARLRLHVIGEVGGLVAQQSPPAGRSVRVGSIVTVTLALPQTVVPSLIGLRLSEITSILEKSYLRLGDVSGQNSDGATTNFQTVPAGTEVPRGTPIGITLYTPPSSPQPQPAQNPDQTPQAPPDRRVDVPSLLTLTRDQAINVLTSTNLKPGRITGPAAGIVNDQSPVGILVDPGSTVDFSLALPPVIVPLVLQDSQSVAESRLRTFSLVPLFRQSADWEPTVTHIVIKQVPDAGATVDAGSSVTIYIGNATPPPNWWEKLPIWKWPASAAVLGLLVFGTWRLVPRPPPNPPLTDTGASNGTHSVSPLATCTLTPHRAEAHIRIADGRSPILHFKLTLHRRPAEGQYTIDEEPAISREG